MAETTLRVLIVDDDEDDFVLSRELLRELQGWTCQVRWVQSVEAAKAEMAFAEYDLYLVDYRLGGQSGLDVLEWLRQHDRATPALLLTGVNDREVDEAAMRLGAADYLVKSELSAVLLERALRYALERARLLFEVEQGRREVEVLYRLSSALEQSGDAHDIMRDAMTLLAELTGVSSLLLWELRSDVAYLRHVQGALQASILQGFQDGLPRSAAPLWQAQAQHVPVYIEDAMSHSGVLTVFKLHGCRSLAHIPLDVSGTTFVLSSLRTQAVGWTPRDRRLLEAGARSVSVALERQRHLELLAAAALTDTLTGLGNRRAFDAALDEALNSARRHAYPVSVVSFDLDGLKSVNDGEGHARGDEFLQEFAQQMKKTLRQEDQLFRLGGDEFAAILRHTGIPGFKVLHERVRFAVANLRAAGFSEADVSTGIAAFPDEARSSGDLMRLSDERMYQEKLRHRQERLVDPADV
ncbi:diguanylate cyclase domain-containing protein [Deinococcus peraridilitoris]|uniref:Diguanylate cyclase (GGDEF) domain-containing protein n=1 Tax=Deinococcus peraridilitoris (strain DSM 19664 / LMG 22246 / CIP 109416 / KR-200) TaxID=937777 RepID=K9ZXP2_DEIPD|nr:diguanylate cyclase [Deinococcus peraridilitoris]AFZ65667.1 diguanylate cyclase (GGDEF) domain-containing protein [Deinococcus peraridilitoris DSM 19664]